MAKIETVYHYTNKRTGIRFVFGCIEAIAQHTDLKVDRLKYYFSRKKMICYNDDTHSIYKLRITRSNNSIK